MPLVHASETHSVGKGQTQLVLLVGIVEMVPVVQSDHAVTPGGMVSLEDNLADLPVLQPEDTQAVHQLVGILDTGLVVPVGKTVVPLGDNLDLAVAFRYCLPTALALEVPVLDVVALAFHQLLLPNCLDFDLVALDLPDQVVAFHLQQPTVLVLDHGVPVQVDLVGELLLPHPTDLGLDLVTPDFVLLVEEVCWEVLVSLA